MNWEKSQSYYFFISFVGFSDSSSIQCGGKFNIDTCQKIDKTEGTVLFKVLSLFEYFDLKYSLFCFLVLDAIPNR